MSDNLSLIQSLYACFGRGDIPALLQMLNEDVSWQFVGDRAAPYTKSVTGRAQVADWFGGVAAAEDIKSFEPQQFLIGTDHVTVLGRERCVARPAGKSYESEWVHVWRLRGGRVSSFWGMFDSEAAGAARN